MSTHSDSLPLNITLSIGDVTFQLAPSVEQAANDGIACPSSSPKLISPRAAARRRRSQQRGQLLQRANADNASPYTNSAPKPEHQPPFLSIRRGKPEQQPPSSNHYSSVSSSATKINNIPPPSPIRQHIIGRVRAMKEKIEVDERRKSATGLNEFRSPEPKNSQSPAQLSGYYVDLHSFTGTLQIMPNNTSCVPSREYNDNNASASDYVTKNSPGYESQSPRKRIVNKNNKLDPTMKRSKTRSFTWIASNESEVEIGMDETKSQGRVQSFMSDGIASEKKFDFVDSVSDSDNEHIGDVESCSPLLPDKAVKFSIGSSGNQSEQRAKQSSTQFTSEMKMKSKSSMSQKIQQSPENLDKTPKNESYRQFNASPIHPVQHLDNGTNNKANTRMTKVEKPRSSLSTPPKLLHYAQQAMKQIGLSGKNEPYNVLGSDPALSTTNSSLRSWNAVGSEPDYNDPNATELHLACGSQDVSRIHRVLENTDASGTMVADSKGKLPIHVLANNRRLITDNSAECEDIADIFAQIMGPHKMIQAIYGPHGWGPFVGIIGRWVDDLHKEIHCQQNDQLASSSGLTNTNQSRTRTAFTQQLPLFRAADRNNERQLLSSVFMKDREKAFFLPYSVLINEHVKWAIRVLSNLIDIYPEQTREGILTNITSTVPLFLKCVFLLNDADDLNRLADMSLIKHAAIDKRSINVWLIAMLTSTNREIQHRAVIFLKLLSQLTLTDLVASSQYRDKFSDKEIQRFVSCREATFDALYSMPGIFPAVLGLGGRGIETLSTTRVVKYITDRTIRKEKQFFRLICDFFYGAFLLLGFRLQVEFVFSVDHRDGPDVYRSHNYWSMSSWALAFYFLIKDLLSLISLYMTSTKLAKRYCTSVFNLIDMAAVLIIVGEGGPLSDDSINTKDGWAASLVTILLWLRLMGAFKILNQSFALFLYAVWEVIKEIKWFLVFLFMVTVMFSDAARAAVAVTGDCSREEYASTDFCSGGYFTVVRMYSILVGDVELDYFGSSNLMVSLFCFFSLFCIIILLNILIAIIIDSYERTKERSREIFGRAQVEYAAALVARNQFIRPKEISEFHVASFVPHALRRILRVVYLIAYTGALVLFEYGFTGAIIYLKRVDSSEFEVTYNLILVYIIVGTIYNAYILSFAVIALFTWCEQINPALGSKIVPIHRAFVVAIGCFHRLMGFDSNLQQQDLSEDVIKH